MFPITNSNDINKSVKNKSNYINNTKFCKGKYMQISTDEKECCKGLNDFYFLSTTAFDHIFIFIAYYTINCSINDCTQQTDITYSKHCYQWQPFIKYFQCCIEFVAPTTTASMAQCDRSQMSVHLKSLYIFPRIGPRIHEIRLSPHRTRSVVRETPQMTIDSNNSKRYRMDLHCTPVANSQTRVPYRTYSDDRCARVFRDSAWKCMGRRQCAEASNHYHRALLVSIKRRSRAPVYPLRRIQCEDEY
ncbi:hypothetical protein AGLY_006240 [Aphis glycines]|uniref:Uncharacterized protein n=1 Tax=Aphis glycines TaxID=307491 RepID=A0A6G0TQH9_APHGL|nr:hypothetical protein AGLY_006240 [Aphis glycines]